MKKYFYILLLALLLPILTELSQSKGLTVIFQSQNWSGNIWTPSSRTGRIYDENKDMIELFSQRWTDTGWVYLSVANYKYQSPGKESEKQVKLWKVDRWENIHYLIIEYDSTGKKISQTSRIWIEENGDWLNDMKYEFEYNSFDSLSQIKTYNWDSGDWSLKDIELYEYNEIFRNSVIVKQTNVDNEMVLESQIQKNYNELGLESKVNTFVWQDEWVNKNKYEFEYTQDSLLTKNTSEYWYEDQWVGYFKDSIIYNENKQFSEVYNFQYDYDNSLWLRNLLTLRFYDNDKELKEVIYQNYIDNKWTNLWRDIRELITGVENEMYSEQISLYPNPALNRAEMSINNCKPGEYLLSVYDVKGKQVYQTKMHNNATGIFKAIVSVENFPNGVYYLSMSNTQVQYFGKLIKE